MLTGSKLLEHFVERNLIAKELSTEQLLSISVSMYVWQEYDNEAEQAISDVAIHYTDTPIDIGMASLVLL